MPDLALIVLKTKQLETVQEFYTALGISFQQEQHGSGPVHYAGFLGETVFEIYPLKDDEQTDSTTRLGFSVENLSQVLDTLVSQDLCEAKEPRQSEWGLRVVLRDPDDRAVELLEKSS